MRTIELQKQYILNRTGDLSMSAEHKPYLDKPVYVTELLKCGRYKVLAEEGVYLKVAKRNLSDIT